MRVYLQHATQLEPFHTKNTKNTPAFVARSKFCCQRHCCCIYSCLSYLQFRFVLFFFCFVARLLAIVVIIGSVIPICGYPRAAYHFLFTTPPTRWLALVRLSVTCNALFLWQHEHPTHTHTQIYLTASKYTAYRPLTHCLLSSYLFWSFDVAACWHVDTVFRGTCNFFGKFAFICCWHRSIATEIVSQPVYVGVGCENFVEWDLHCLPAGCIHSLFPSVFCFV